MKTQEFETLKTIIQESGTQTYDQMSIDEMMSRLKDGANIIDLSNLMEETINYETLEFDLTPEMANEYRNRFWQEAKKILVDE